MVKKKAKKKTAKSLWSAGDLATLKKLFPANSTSIVAKAVKRKADAVKKKASRMGLKKAKKYLKTIGRA